MLTFIRYRSISKNGFIYRYFSEEETDEKLYEDTCTLIDPQPSDKDDEVTILDDTIEIIDLSADSEESNEPDHVESPQTYMEIDVASTENVESQQVDRQIHATTAEKTKTTKRLTKNRKQTRNPKKCRGRKPMRMYQVQKVLGRKVKNEKVFIH